MSKFKYIIAFLLLMAPAFGQRPALVSPVIRFSDNNGKPLASGKLFSYSAQTTTPLSTYTDSTTGAVNTNPVILDSTGSARVFLGANVYKFVLQNSAGVVQWTADNIAQGMFDSSYVTSVFGRTGVVTAQSGDYSCAQVIGAICTLPPAQTLYYQTVQAVGASAVQEPILNFIAGVSGSVGNPTITAGGSGYSGGPTVTFTGGACTVLPTGSATVSTGSISNPTVTSGGSGYTSAPTVVFSGGGGSGAAATAILSGASVVSFTITNAGTGYTSAPAVSFTGGGGTGAAGTVALQAAGTISALVINTAGAGCSTDPAVSFSGGGGSGAAATVTVQPNGISCTDNPTAHSTDCTFTVGGGSSSGGACTLTDQTSSRSLGGIYQNTTNGLMYISGSGNTTGSSVGTMLIAEGASTPTQNVFMSTPTATVSNGSVGFFTAILPGYFYQVTGTGAINGISRLVEITGCGGGSGGGSAGVSSVNVVSQPALTGAVAFACGVGLTCSQAGQTITISIASSFTINSFTGCSGSNELGFSITNPTCSATYSGTPTSANITNSEGISSPTTLTTPFTSGTITGTFAHSSSFTTTFVLTAMGSSTQTATQTETWNPAIFGGVGATGATSTVTASGTTAVLSTSDVLPRAQLGAETVGEQFGPYFPTGQNVYLLLTGGSHTFTDACTGFPFAFNSPIAVSFVNANGVSVVMFLYGSTNPLTGSGCGFKPKVAS